MFEAIKASAESKMKKALEALQNELARLRTGRAHPSLLDGVRVKYYDNEVPLSQVATVSVSDARSLLITPWEKTMIAAVEKAIMAANLGLNPATTGTVIRVPMPMLTEERRREMTKLVKNEAENSRVSIRNLRRDANNQLKELLKKKVISEDDERHAQDSVQKLTDKYIVEADRIAMVKEKELMEV